MTTMNRSRTTTFRRQALLASVGLLVAHAAFAQPAPQPAPATVDRSAALFAAAKAASGGAAWDGIVTWTEHGTLAAGGLSGTYDTTLDYPHLRQVIAYVIGPDKGAGGWDGHVAWTTDASGQVRVEASREATAAAIGQAYFSANAFLFPGRYPSVMTYAGMRTDGGGHYDVVTVTPEGAEPQQVWLDQATHLVAREVQLTGIQPQTSLFSDFVVRGGVRVPGRTVVRVGGNAAFDQVSQQGGVVLNRTLPAGAFAPPPPPAYDATFPAGASSVTVPFRLLNNHIYLDVSIDGRPAQPFIFDTGATNYFDTTHARALGVAIAGSLPGGGFGSAIASTGLAKVASVSIGGLVLHDQVFAAGDDTAWAGIEGADSAGLVGYEFVKRAVTTIDYANRTITFTRPDAFRPPSAPPIPFTFDFHIPMVQATLDGNSGEFEIDTGSRGALTLMTPFVDAHGLVARYKATRLATTGYGTGGPSRSLLARPALLTIGPVALHAPIAELVQDKGGAAAAARTAGNIGGDLLKRFTVTLDYGHQRLWLVPNSLAGTTEVFDRSGLWLSRAADRSIAIADVTPGSAAAKAGLVATDEIVSVDGHRATTIPLFALRERFKQPGPAKFSLAVRNKAGTTRTIALYLADQV